MAHHPSVSISEWVYCLSTIRLLVTSAAHSTCLPGTSTYLSSTFAVCPSTTSKTNHFFCRYLSRCIFLSSLSTFYLFLLFFCDYSFSVYLFHLLPSLHISIHYLSSIFRFACLPLVLFLSTSPIAPSIFDLRLPTNHLSSTSDRLPSTCQHVSLFYLVYLNFVMSVSLTPHPTRLSSLPAMSGSPIFLPAFPSRHCRHPHSIQFVRLTGDTTPG